MAEEEFRVIFTERAWADLEDIVEFWTDRDELERGVQYAHDLPGAAIRTLSIASQARAGRHLRHSAYPDVQELPVFKRSYRILYRVDENQGVVEVLRFWHSHRDEPFRSPE